MPVFYWFAIGRSKCVLFGGGKVFVWDIYDNVPCNDPNFLNKMSRIYDPSIKGTLGSFNQLLIVFGMIVSYMMAYILPRTI